MGEVKTPAAQPSLDEQTPLDSSRCGAESEPRKNLGLPKDNKRKFKASG